MTTRYVVPSEWASRAAISGDLYDQMHARSIADPECCGREQAGG